MIAIRKNRREKGSRADPRGSNPHSKGEFFSRSVTVFLARMEDTSITTAPRTSVIRIIVKTIKITLSDSCQTSRLEAECTLC